MWRWSCTSVPGELHPCLRKVKDNGYNKDTIQG